MRQNDRGGAAAAKRLMREAQSGALGTLSSAGGPFVSLVAVAIAPTGAPLLLLSRLARHSENIARDPRVALMVQAAGEEGDRLSGGRLTLIGRLAPTDDAAARRHFLARHPDAFYAEFADFGLWQMDIERGHFIAGFGQIIELAPNELMSAPEDDRRG